MRDGLPIGLGYFAVAFSLGIAARGYGFSAFQGFLASLLTYASAGQYMGFSLYAANTTLAELVILTFIINARYVLMGFALNQRMPEGTPLGTRMLVGTCITDEIFALCATNKGKLTPSYMYGILIVAAFGWTSGTIIGAAAGEILPASVTNAMGIMLYGMFLAIIIPPSKKQKSVFITVIIASLISLLFKYVFSAVSGGFAVIISAVIAAAAAALFFPVKEEEAAQ